MALATTRTFSFRAEAGFAERHDRALAVLDRLRRERPRLADSVRYDFDVRLAQAQQRGLRTPAERLRATVEAFIGAVEEAVADERWLDVSRPRWSARRSPPPRRPPRRSRAATRTTPARDRRRRGGVVVRAAQGGAEAGRRVLAPRGQPAPDARGRARHDRQA